MVVRAGPIASGVAAGTEISVMPKAAAAAPHLLEVQRVRRIGRVPQEGDTRDRRHHLAQHLEPFGAALGAEDGIPGDVAAGVRQARDEAGAERIADADHHDRRARGRRTRSERGDGA